MGGHPRQSQGGGASMPAAAPAAPAGPKLVNNQIQAGLKGTIGGAWTPEQTQAGGRWEVPAGAPAGAIGRNWVPYSAPAPVEPRQEMARIMQNSPSDSRWGYPSYNRR